MQTFDEWKSWYEAHAEPADPIEVECCNIDHFATDDY